LFVIGFEKANVLTIFGTMGSNKKAGPFVKARLSDEA